jgi:hypothetical protein
MRLAGIRLAPSVTGGASSFIALSDVSVLVGRNDVGKSRILKAIVDSLGDATAEPDTNADKGRPGLYMELDESAMAVIDETLGAPIAGREDLRRSAAHVFGRAVDETSQWFSRLVREAQIESIKAGRSGAEARVMALRHAAGLSAKSWDPLFERLAESRIAYARPEGGRWALEWCLPAETAREEAIAELLERFSLAPSAPGEPLPVAPLSPWLVTGRGLPEARAIPTQDGQLAADVTRRIDAACSEGPIAEMDREAYQEFIVELFKRLVALALPAFISRGYELEVTIAPTGRVLLFKSRDGKVTLAPEEMADGFKVWIELALRDASEVIERAAKRLVAVGQRSAELPEYDEAARAFLFVHEHGEVLGRALQSDPGAAAAAFTSTAPLLALEAAADEDRAFVEQHGSDELGIAFGRGMHGVPLYLIDEPERHLHPSLAREAAAWLAEVTAPGPLLGQVMIASHNVAFLSMPAPVVYTLVRREQGITIPSIMPAGELDGLGLLSDELGLDRGELMTTRRVFAFVEGEVDRIVFAGLFGDRLRAAGIQLVPMHGVRNAPGVVEGDILFGLLNQRIAAIVDDVVLGGLPHADERAKLKKLKDGKKNRTVGIVAALLLSASYAERDVEVLAIPGPDIIAELDDQAIRDVMQSDYPGRERSIEEWQSSSPQSSWKRFCTDRDWFQSDPDSIRRVVTAMAGKYRIPVTLEHVIGELERLSERVATSRAP